MANKKKTDVSEEVIEKLSEVMDVESEPTNIDFANTTKDIKISDDTLINVKSNCFGKLRYIGKDGRTEWMRCGEIQQLTFRELRDMKATSPKFYEAQWIIPVGASSNSDCAATPADVIEKLGVSKMYKNLVDPSSFRDICGWSENEIPEKISMLARGAKENLVIALNSYVRSGALDSISKKKAFEKALGVELADKE